MWTGLLVLPDGSELYSGDPARDAVMAITHTSRVQGEAEDLVPGGVASDELQIKVWLKAGGTLRITAGEELVYYRLDAAGKRTLVGHFLTDKPTRSSRNAYKITARDRMSLTDVDLSPWLRSIQGEFPMTLATFARRVAEKCGLTLADGLPRNGDYLVRAFYADDLTGRQLLSWVAEATATFCHCTPAGEIAFSWYQPFGPRITPATTVIPTIYRPDGRVFRQGVEEYGYLSGSLTYEDYTTPAIDKVQIRQSDSDVGVIYPAEEQGSNAWVIQSNLLLTTDSDANLRPVAQALYEAFRGIDYTPCSFSVPASVEIEAGSIVELEDVRGNRFTTYVMEATVSGSKRTLRSTGNAKRDGNAATNRQILKNLTGKMLEIQTSVDGLDIKASQLDGDFAELQLTVEGLSSRVEQDFTDLQGYVDEQTGKVLESAQSAITQTSTQIRSEVKASYSVALTGNLLEHPDFSDAEAAENVQIANGRLTAQANGKNYYYYTQLSQAAHPIISNRYLRVRFLYRCTQAFSDASDSVSILIRAYSNDVITTWRFSDASRPFASLPVKEWQIYDAVTDTPVCQDVGATEVYFDIGLQSDTGTVEIRDFYIGVAEAAELDKELERYKTEASSALTQTANTIRAEVSATYAPLSYVDEKTGQALESANSALEQTATQIRTEVSANYATKAYADSASAAALQSAQSTITQTADTIRAEVKATYATQEYAASAASDALASAQSAISQSASQIRTEISASYATKSYADTAADSALQSAKSSITQSATSIKAEVSANYATKSSLNSYTKTGEVRSKFAMDPSSITVESGAVKFKGNTFQVEATNFSVDPNGTVRLVTADSYSRATIANGVFEIACKRSGSWRRAVTMASHNTGVSDVICYDESNKPAIYMMYTDGVEVSSDGSSVGFGNKYAMLQFGNGAGITSGIVGYNQSIPGQSLIFYGSSERQYGLKLGVTDGTWALAPVTARYLGLGTREHPFDTIYCKQVVQV